MGTGKLHLNHRGLTLLELLVVMGVLLVGLLAILSVYTTGYLNVTASGGKSKATTYAQQKLEELKNQPFTPGSISAADSLDSGEFTRTWTITPVAGTDAPNRLARITVTVTWNGNHPQTVILETMRAE